MHTPALHRFYQWAEIAIAGKQHDMVHVLRDFHRIHRQFDIHVAFAVATTVQVGEISRNFRDYGEAIVIEKIDQRTNREAILIFDEDGVIERPDKAAAVLKLVEEALVVDLE